MFQIDLGKAKEEFPFLEQFINNSRVREVFICEADKEIYDRCPTDRDDHRAIIRDYEYWQLYLVRSNNKFLIPVNMKMGITRVSPARNWIAGPSPDDDDYTLEGESVRNALSRCNLEDVEYVILHGCALGSSDFNSLLIGRFLPL